MQLIKNQSVVLYLNLNQDTSQPIPGNSNQKKLISRKNYHRKEAFSLVGTPNYIAPEVLQVSFIKIGFLLNTKRHAHNRVVGIQNHVIGGQWALFSLKWSLAMRPFMRRARNKLKKRS